MKCKGNDDMKFNELLTELKADVETHLEEDVMHKGKKYYAVKNNSKEILPGTKQDGYLSLENAVKAMLSATSKDFTTLSFSKKKERVDKYIKKWKSRKGEKDKKPKKKHGFETLD